MLTAKEVLDLTKQGQIAWIKESSIHDTSWSQKDTDIFQAEHADCKLTLKKIWGTSTEDYHYSHIWLIIVDKFGSKVEYYFSDIHDSFRDYDREEGEKVVKAIAGTVWDQVIAS